ncbi:hypothetical protein [Stackebrandtia soli]|uniref:hypothetical protein n=1 Tax=Stackebrandtia soli TaxID=1892856 RepID=UPI0039ED6443
MVDFKELREVVIDPLIEFADHARKVATELEQFGTETDIQKKILSAVWAGMDAIAAINALTGHTSEYTRTSHHFKEVDTIVTNLANRLKWAKEMLESVISMAPSIPGVINQDGSIKVNYAALGPNPAQAEITAAENRAKQVQAYIRQALQVATEADQTAQSQLAQIMGGTDTANRTMSTTSGEDGTPGEGKPGEGEPGTGEPGEGKPGEGDPGTGQPGDGKPGSGEPGTGQPGDGKPGEGEPGGKPGDGKPGEGDPERSKTQKIGDALNSIGELLSGGDGNASGDRSLLEKIGDVMEGAGEALGGDGDRNVFQLIGDVLTGVGDALEGDSGAGDPGTGDPGTGDPGTGDPGTGDPGTGDPGTGDPGTGDPGTGDPGTGDPGTGDPGTGDPGTGDPGTGDPGTGDPGTGNPGEGDPGNGSPGGNPGEGDPGTGNPGEGDPGTGDPGTGDPGTGNPGEGDPGAGDGDGDGDGDGEDDGDGDGGPVGIPEPIPGFNAAQMANAVSIIEAGEALGISERGQAIAIATALQESTLRNLANDSVPASLDIPNEGVGSDHDSVGLFQQRSRWWGPIEELMDPTTSATKFYEALERVPNWENMELTDAAATVQRPAEEYRGEYAKWEDEAYAILRARNGN